MNPLAQGLTHTHTHTLGFATHACVYRACAYAWVANADRAGAGTSGIMKRLEVVHDPENMGGDDGSRFSLQGLRFFINMFLAVSTT